MIRARGIFMKRIMLAAFFFLCAALSFAKDPELQAIDDLVARKQYLDAIGKAVALDAAKFGSEAIWYKVEISTKYFIVSLNHRMFGFRNLDISENIEDLRGKEGSYSMIAGDLDEEVKTALAAYPESALVHEAAGTYYVDLFRRYEGNAGYEAEELFALITKHYLASADLAAPNLTVCANLGEFFMYQEFWQDSIKWYGLALGMDSKNATYHYNTAYSLIELGRLEEAAGFAKTATELYTDSWYRADAFMMFGYINQQMLKFDECLASFNKAIEIDPELDYPYVQIIGTYLHLEKYAAANEFAATFIARRLDAFDSLQAILNFYAGYGRSADAIAIFDALLPAQSGNSFNTGSVLFHRGLLRSSSDPALAEADYRSALAAFTEALGADHNVCVTIRQMLGE
jgi:tetratricopeptide (TPR) repeat protein